MPLYYGDGGPGPHSKLLRVDMPDNDLSGWEWQEAWHAAPAYRWAPHTGWVRAFGIQMEIRWTGDYGLVDEDEVPQIQQQIREQYAKYRIA
jgi:hypothetical protein